MGLCFLLASPAYAAAQSTPPPSAPQINRTFAPFVLNGKNSGNALIVILPKDVLLRVADLQRAGVSSFAGTRTQVLGDEYVSLNSLAPTFTYAFDPKTLTLSVTANNARLFGSNVIDLLPPLPSNTVFVNDRGAFFNYALGYSRGSSPSAFLENGIDLRHALLLNSLTYAGPGALQRGLSQLLFDSRSHTRRTIVGDSIANTGVLGGAAVLGGLSVTRQFSLTPYLITFPTPALQGQVLLPSKADIYINGRLVQTIDLPPGVFNLIDIPAGIGPTQARVVIRNALGVAQEIGTSLFTVEGLLRPGLTDYQYAIGKIRQDAVSGTSYGPTALMARYAVGVNDRLTLGARIEAQPGLESGGFDIVKTFGNLGFQVAAAASRAQGLSGSAASIQLTLPARRLGLGGSLQWETPHYTTIGQAPTGERVLRNFALTASFALTPRTLIAASMQNILDSVRGPFRQTTLQLSQQLSRTSSLLVQSSSSFGTSLLGAVADKSFSVSLVRAVGLRGNLGISQVQDTSDGVHTQSTNVSLSEAAPEDFGWSYDASLALGSLRSGATSLQYTGMRGNGGLFLSNAGGNTSTELTYSGGIAYIGGRFALTRSVNDAFGLVSAPGLAGARVYANNRYEGMTNGAGYLVVPDLISEIPNAVRLELPQGSMNATISNSTTNPILNYHGAGIFRYAVQHVEALLVNLLLQRKTGAPIVPQYGQLVLTNATGEKQTSEIDADGRAYFNDLPPGTYAGHVLFENDDCSLQVNVPVHAQALLMLGTLTCVEH